MLSNKVAIVTGAGRGLGRGIALKLATEGAKVVVADMAPADETVALIEKIWWNSKCIYCKCF